MLPVPVVKVVTVTAVAKVLLISTLPLVVSAVMVEPANSRTVVSPIPVTALRSITLAVTKPEPLIEPSEVITTSSPAAVVVPVKITLPPAVVVRLTLPSVPAVTEVPTVRFAPVLLKVILPSVVVAEVTVSV